MLKTLPSTLLATAWSFCLAREPGEDDLAESLPRRQRQQPGLTSQQLESLREPDDLT
jgi:hypothetical protein